MPKIGLFAQAYYGYPGLDYFENMIHRDPSFNVLAGIVPEAPRWMQKLSLEWLYRLMQEPRRLFKRYLVTNTKFLVYQFAHIERKKGKR